MKKAQSNTNKVIIALEFFKRLNGKTYNDAQEIISITERLIRDNLVHQLTSSQLKHIEKKELQRAHIPYGIL